MNKIIKIAILSVLGIALSIAIGVYIFYKNINAPIPTESKNTQQEQKNNDKQNESETPQKNILFIGSDDNNLSDTLFVATYDSKTKQINMLSIPRDTYYPRPGFNGPKDKKINAAFSEQKIEGSIKAVEGLLGINIDNYVILSYKGFEKIIDIIGGVEVDIPFNMQYDDNSSNPPLHINLKKGKQLLDGEKALEFVRYRHGYAEGDLGRINAQQEFLRSFIQKVTEPSIITKLPSLALTISNNLKTDLSASDITKYVYTFIKDKPITLNAHTLPGEGRYQGEYSYFFVDTPKASELVDQLFNKKETSSLSQNDENTIQLNKNINVEILNGAGIPGLATKYAEILKKQGFNIVKIGNVNGIEYASSHVYARTDIDKAQKVAEALSISSPVENDNILGSNIDVTVILGKDKN
ncbi:MAG: LCP family protein [Thermoanaerobacteraceae bacterium]